MGFLPKESLNEILQLGYPHCVPHQEIKMAVNYLSESTLEIGCLSRSLEHYSTQRTHHLI